LTPPWSARSQAGSAPVAQRLQHGGAGAVGEEGGHGGDGGVGDHASMTNEL
jgi:hypothetical protein